MSFKRNPNEDRASTCAVLSGQRPVDDGEKNWLGHRLSNRAAQIDAMLLKGATKRQILQRIAPRRNDVNAHFSHLRNEHGLPLAAAGEVWTFDRQKLRG